MRANRPMHPVTMKMMLPADNPIRIDDTAVTVKQQRYGSISGCDVPFLHVFVN